MMLNIINHQGNANQNHNEAKTALSIQITTVRYHFTPVRMTVIKKTRDNMLVRMWRKGTLVLCWWKCKLVQPLWKTVWRCLRRWEIELPNDPIVLLLVIYWKKLKSGTWRDISTLVFIVVLSTISQDVETISMFIRGWMDNQNVVHNIREYCSALKRRKSCCMWWRGWTLRMLS